MRLSTLRLCSAFWVGLAVATSDSPAQIVPPPATGSAPEHAGRPLATTRAVAPSEEQIRQAIRDLNHPSPGKRREAVRRLADWGPLAFDALGVVAAGSELEPALLARDLLRQMGEVLFVGGRVRLEADRVHIRWDEPVNLAVQIDNPTPGRVVVPWPAGVSTTTGPADTGPPHGSDADQVAAVMDIADHLSVVGPDDQPVELRVDPLEQDTAVYHAVMIRAGDHPPSHAVPAETSERLHLRQFNRGWARHPMLAAGRYTIRFAYQPQWNDPNWIAQGFGRIESNPITIEVTEPAPAEIREATRPVRLGLRRDGDKVIGELQNVWDRQLWLNLNVNGPIGTHARLEWRAQAAQGSQAEDDEVEPFTLDSDASGPQFATDHVKLLSPGAKAVITKADIGTLAERARRGTEAPGPLSVTLKYAHIPSSQDLRQTLREKGRRESIPAQVFSGSAMSEPIAIPPAGE